MKEYGVRKYPTRRQPGRKAERSLNLNRRFLAVLNFLAGYVSLIALLGFLSGFVSAFATYLPGPAANIMLPLALPNQIAVDDKGLIYCGLGYYGKIQVYSQEGKFLRGWFVGYDKFGMTIRGGKVLVTTFDNRHYNYDLYGNLLGMEDHGDPGRNGKYEEDLAGLRGNGLGPVKDGAGNEYFIEPHWLIPKLAKISVSGERIVLLSNPFYLAIFAGPIASWLCFAVTGRFYAYTSRKLEIPVSGPSE